ncbi:hypothetical protein BH23BAC4_BH23BAC4_05350 [soil metagenome]
MRPFVFTLFLLGSILGCGDSRVFALREGGRTAAERADRPVSQRVNAAELQRAVNTLRRGDSGLLATYAANAMRDAGLMPLVTGSFFIAPVNRTPLPLAEPGRLGVPQPTDRIPLVAPGEVHVAAFIPGRDPALRDQLVSIYASQRDIPAAIAVLEVARLLAEEARFSGVPGRSIMIVLIEGTDPRAEVQHLAKRPLWEQSGIHSVIDVGEIGIANDDLAIGTKTVPNVSVLALPSTSTASLSEMVSLTDAVYQSVRVSADVAQPLASSDDRSTD